MTLDANDIKTRIDLRDFIERDIGKPHTSSNAYNLYQCPLHRETKGYSFAVYADHYTCYGKCNETGDLWTWMERYHGIPFKAAVRQLGGAAQNRSSLPKRQPERQPSEPDTPPSEAWQFNASLVVEQAQKTLWSDAGKPAMDYLRTTRGLLPSMIEEARLGYIPGRPDEWIHPLPEWKKPDGKTVGVPCGITIPHVADDNLWAVRVRRAAGDIKYQGIPGGSKALYWSDNISAGMPILITEGEFDCLVAEMWALDIVCPVSLASASNWRINRRWYPRLITAPLILVRVDSDAAGENAATQLQQLSHAVRVVKVPETKDINDYYLKCGPIAVFNWLESELERLAV